MCIYKFSKCQFCLPVSSGVIVHMQNRFISRSMPNSILQCSAFFEKWLPSKPVSLFCILSFSLLFISLSDTDSSQVKETFIPRATAVHLISEYTSDSDSEPSRTVQIPSLTFNRELRNAAELSKKMSRWLKDALGSFLFFTLLFVH